MFKLVNKKFLSTLFVALSMTTLSSSVQADDCCYYTTDCCPTDCCSNDSRFYIGGFGGQLFLGNDPEIRQRGNAFFSEVTSIGPLTVDARGRAGKKNDGQGFGGVQIGYEFKPSFGSSFGIAVAGEVEALFFSRKHSATITNPTSLLEAHIFDVSLKTDVQTYLINGVVSFDLGRFACCMSSFSPYIGGGVGTARTRLHNATSFQIDPAEVGVNHFDSDNHDAAWTFAAQAKAGLRYNIWEHFSIFAEYRFLYIDTNRWLLGATEAPGHVPTTTWNVDLDKLYFNSWVVGVQFSL